MSISVRIAGWQSQGLRCPDHSISLVQKNDTCYPISLLQMPNGTGKTTTLELLRATLSGAAERGAWSSEKILSFRKRIGERTPEGFFEVALLADEQRLTFRMLFDFDQVEVRYTTTVSSGMKQGFHPPLYLQRFLHPAFVNFFIFDGELAQNLLNKDHTDAQNAIEILFQLGIFQDIENRVNDYWDEQISGQTATEGRGLSRRHNKVKRLRERIQELEKDQNNEKINHEGIKTKLQDLRGRFQHQLDENKENREKVQQAEEALSEAESRVKSLSQRVLAKSRNPHALSESFALSISQLKLGLDRVKLPESAAREFFEELAEEEECVCGRPLEEAHRLAIRDRAGRYLGSDDVAMLNALKSDVTDIIGEDLLLHEQDLDKVIEELKTAIGLASKRITERDAARHEAVVGDPALQDVQKEIDELENEEIYSLTKLRKYEDPSDTASDSDTFGIVVLQKRFDKAEKDLAEITDTLVLKEKINIIAEVISRSLSAARASLSMQMRDETNKRIEQLMPSNYVRVDTVDRSLLLEGGGASAGETLSIAYAFLATLFDRGAHRLPFIVDSPAGPLDYEVRPEVAELIPGLSNQFIGFVISSERSQFLAPLQKAANSEIQYVTMFRKGIKGTEDLVKSNGGATETIDGFLVEDQEFFESFQVEEEE